MPEWAVIVARALSPKVVRRYLGVALIPQAGVAVGLVVLIQDDASFSAIQHVFVTAVLVTVATNEILGPILTRIGLNRSGEAGRDRPRVMDFPQEENIITDLRAKTKEEAIAQLTDLLIQSHHLVGVDRDRLLASVLEREVQMSTFFGRGLAIPHGRLEGKDEMVGVMGISEEGLPFESNDGMPTHCIVLLATPEGQRERHLEVLSSLVLSMGTDPGFRDALYQARSAAHAYEILHSGEREDFNRYLDTDESTNDDPS